MNCELCGREIPKTLDVCPNCGIPIGYAKNSPGMEDDFPGGKLPDDPFAPDEPYNPYGGYPGESWPPPEYPGSGDMLPPGTSPFPEHEYDYERREGWEMPPGNRPVSKARKTWRRISALVSIVIVLALLTVGGIIGYRTISKPSSPLQEVNALLDKYFNAVESGDSATVASLHAPDMQPSQAVLDEISSSTGVAYREFSNLSLKQLSKTENEMQVEIVDGEIAAGFNGDKQKTKISTFTQSSTNRAATSKIRLKKVNDKWLINENYIVQPFQILPP